MSLAHSNVDDFYESVEVPKKEVNIERRSKTITPSFINDYQSDLKNRNYAPSTIKPHLSRTKQFWKFFIQLHNKDASSSSLDELRLLTYDDVLRYENHLINRIRKKEIKDETAYSCIKNIKLFLNFLYHKKIINFQYTIPKKFVVQPTRLNSYIDKNLIQDLIISTFAIQSRNKYRFLAILFLLVETGCRPIELANLKMCDLKLTEKKIIFNSIKSDKRTLSLDRYVIKVLKRYIKIRKDLKSSEECFFLLNNGKPMRSKNFSDIVYDLNKKAFGQNLINARALRHTYITNAIDNNNEIKDLAEAVGHKHWDSTIYYLHRSKKRLLENTLSFNPIKLKIEE